MAQADTAAMHAEVGDSPKLRKPSSRSFSGYVQHISRPAYASLMRHELPLRRLVPVLIVIFLSLLAVARWAFLDDQRTQLLSHAVKELHLISELSELQISTLTANGTVDILQQDLQNRLSDLFPAKYLTQNRLITITNQYDKIIATAPYDAELIGQTIESVFGDVVLLTVLGRTAESRKVQLPNGDEALAMHRVLDAPLGGVTVVQPTKPLLASWKKAVSVNVTLFVGTSSILLIILYAYFAQGARAKEADAINDEIQNRFDTALARGRGGLWDWDLAGGEIYWSASMYELLGYKPFDGALGFDTVANMINAEDMDFHSVSESILSGDSDVVDRTFRVRHADEYWVWIRVRAQRIVNANGEIHLIGIGIDVGEQQRLKVESRQKDMRLQDAIENLSEAFVLWDSDRRLITCNTKYQELHGISPASARAGITYEEFMALAQTPRVLTELVHPSNEKGARSMEAQLEDGRWLQINERKTKDGGFVSVGTDITSIKLNEGKLIDSEKRLMATVEDLQATRNKLEIQAKQLVELAEKYAKEKNNAEAANQTKSEFLANISHELRTPLNAIIGFSEIMNKGMFGPLGSEKYLEYSQDIHESGTFLLNVINDVLDMSKIEAGRFFLERDQVNLTDILQESLRIVSFQADQREIKFENLTHDTISLFADKRALKQILLNLLSNASKFSTNGGTVMVRAKRVGECVRISIEDHGVGISKQDLNRIGRPFEQVQNQFTKSHTGSGLGLAISKSLAEMHGGSMRIRSKVGKGTIVSLMLPATQSDKPLCKDEDLAEEMTD